MVADDILAQVKRAVSLPSKGSLLPLHFEPWSTVVPSLLLFRLPLRRFLLSPRGAETCQLRVFSSNNSAECVLIPQEYAWPTKLEYGTWGSRFQMLDARSKMLNSRLARLQSRSLYADFITGSCKFCPLCWIKTTTFI